MPHAVVDSRGDDIPEVYVFATEEDADRFARWLAEGNPDVFVCPISEPPADYRTEV